MYRECRSLQLPLVDMLLLSFLCSQVGAEWKSILATRKLLVVQVLCSVCLFRHFAPRTMLLHSLPVKCLYTGSINLHNIQCIDFQQSTVEQWHFHTRKSVLMVGSLLLFKTERVLSAIQQTCFCQLWVIVLIN